jgi:tRNA A37 threonylcarbamoyladenosine biosynthesis protein TsaE
VLAQPKTLVCVEWSERIAAVLPTHAISATLILNADETRTLTINS